MRNKPDVIIQRTIAALLDSGIDCEPLPTTGPLSATRLAAEAVRGGAGLVIALGGDGTINEVANGMVGSRVPLAILPAGTANVLAMELRLGSSIKGAIRKLATSSPERISLGLLRNQQGQRYFVLMAGAGLDAEIVYSLSASLKRAFGKAAYWIAGFSHLTRPMAQFSAVNGTGPHEVGFALASRVRNYGGDLEIATGANLLENQMQLVLFHGSNPLLYGFYFLGVIARVLHRLPGIRMQPCRKTEFFAPQDHRIYVQVDGEFAGQLPATVEVVDDALTLLVPEEFRRRFKSPARDRELAPVSPN